MVGEIIIDRNLQGLWHLNGNSNDSSKNGLNGTDTSITYGQGKFNQAAIFNGTSGYITLSTIPDLTSDFTIMFWANCDQVGSDSGLITKRDAFATIDCQISESSAGSGQIEYFGGGVNVFNGSNCTLEVGKWIHVCITRSGNTWSIYKNSELTKQVTQAATITTGDSWRLGALGNDAKTGSSLYKGLMDEVVFYDRALDYKDLKDYYGWALGKFTKVI